MQQFFLNQGIGNRIPESFLMGKPAFQFYSYFKIGLHQEGISPKT